MTRSLLRFAKYPLAAALLMASVPAIPTQPLGGVLQAATQPCVYYANWKLSGNSVICYGAGGSACVVCPT